MDLSSTLGLDAKGPIWEIMTQGEWHWKSGSDPLGYVPGFNVTKHQTETCWFLFIYFFAVLYI